MKVPFTFIGIFVLSCLFLGFSDDRTAFERAVPVKNLTESQDLWARKVITLYDNHYHDYFLFSSDQIPVRTLIHDLCQYFIILSITYMLWERSAIIESYYVITFFVFTVIDLVDYFLTHNGTFFSVNIIPVTWNTISVLLYPIISIYIYFKYGHQ